MYRDQISGNWHILKGKFLQHWGAQDLDHVSAAYEEELSGRIQKIYHLNKQQADRELKEWIMSDHDPHYHSSGSTGVTSSGMGV